MNKKQLPAFRTIQIVGEQARLLLKKARSRMNTAKKDDEHEFDRHPIREDNEKEEPIVSVRLSTTSVAKSAFTILAIALFVLFCYQIRSTLLLLLLAIFLSVVIDPGVSFLEKWKIPRGFCIILVYVIALALILFMLISLIPILAEQIQTMAVSLGDRIDVFLGNPTLRIPFLSDGVNQYLTTIINQFLADVYTGGVLQGLQQFGKDLSSAAQGSVIFIAGVAGSVVQFVVRLILVLVLCFFFQLQKENILRWARVLLPYRLRRYADAKADAIRVKLAQWIRGQLVLSLSIGILVFIALSILGRDYALTLAVLAFFAEFVPVAGPIIAAIPAIFIALAQSGPFPALIVALTYYGIQWCENNLLVPLIMHRAVGLSPIAIISAMLIGVSFPETLHPVIGILLAVPTATIISIFVQDYRDWRGGLEDD